MSVSLYRKYRSKSLDEIVGQKGVVRALKTAIDKGSLSHAYLFTGPRGVGKTSIARILAFAINNTPYSSDELPVDIIEIDAASNRGIEEIRDLREKVKVAPINSRYKVYIIDEVHMLTTPAFNALLKTLEEPPSHVIFILATTEGHKLPETIISRTQRYNFSLATLEEVTEHLQNIAKKEDINIDKPALELIAIHSGGSMRDALSTLDHVRHLSDKITLEDVRTNIGLPSQEVIEDVLEYLAINDASSLLKELKEAEKNNISAAALANGLIDTIKARIQENTLTLSLDKTTNLIKALSEIESSNKPGVLLTVSLLGAMDAKNTVANQPAKAKKPATVKNVEPISLPNEQTEQSDTKIISPQNTATQADLTPPSKEFTQEDWADILEDIRSTHNTLYSVLRIAQIDLSQINSRKLGLNFEFPFHKKRISEKRNQEIIQQKLSGHGFSNIEVICGVASTQDDINSTADVIEAAVNENDSSDELSRIRGVFDGAEAME